MGGRHPATRQDLAAARDDVANGAAAGQHDLLRAGRDHRAAIRAALQELDRVRKELGARDGCHRTGRCRLRSLCLETTASSSTVPELTMKLEVRNAAADFSVIMLSSGSGCLWRRLEEGESLTWRPGFRMIGSGRPGSRYGLLAVCGVPAGVAPGCADQPVDEGSSVTDGVVVVRASRVHRLVVGHRAAHSRGCCGGRPSSPGSGCWSRNASGRGRESRGTG